MSTAIRGTGTDFAPGGSEAAAAELALERIGALPATEPPAEPALTRAARRHAALLGLAIVALSLAACLAAALLIAAGPFHTSFGSLL